MGITSEQLIVLSHIAGIFAITRITVHPRSGDVTADDANGKTIVMIDAHGDITYLSPIARGALEG